MSWVGFGMLHLSDAQQSEGKQQHELLVAAHQSFVHALSIEKHVSICPFAVDDIVTARCSAVRRRYRISTGR